MNAVVHLTSNTSAAEALLSELRAHGRAAELDVRAAVDGDVRAITVLVLDALSRLQDEGAAREPLHLVLRAPPTFPAKSLAALAEAFGPDIDVVVSVGEPLAASIDLDLPALVVAPERSAAMIRRFARASAGAVVTPSSAEQAMMAASVAARRSAAIRGGVGASLVDAAGDVLLLGTAEVPRAGGGQYWDGDPDDARDHLRGRDPAEAVRHETVTKLLEHLTARGGSLPGALAEVAPTVLADFDRAERAGGIGLGRLGGTFESLGRVVHAEMAVLCQAARLGLRTDATTLFVTAASCRQCLRHAVCAGLRSVVHLGGAIAAPPELLADSVTTDHGRSRPDPRVTLLPFEGVSPGLYPRLFGVRPSRREVVEAARAARWATRLEAQGRLRSA